MHRVRVVPDPIELTLLFPCPFRNRMQVRPFYGNENAMT